MWKTILILYLILSCQSAHSQKRLKAAFPKSAVNVQYAGSIGFMSVGFFKVTKRERLEIGLLYGNVPEGRGGPLHLLTLKGIYDPFRFQIGNKIMLEPLQTGLFVSQNFNENLKARWGQNYPKGYYWWARSTRLHIFAGTQVSYKIGKKIDRVACYFETNTNTLYVSSYFPNAETMKLYDIIFFGFGGKIYLR